MYTAEEGEFRVFPRSAVGLFPMILQGETCRLSRHAGQGTAVMQMTGRLPRLASRLFKIDTLYHALPGAWVDELRVSQV